MVTFQVTGKNRTPVYVEKNVTEFCRGEGDEEDDYNLDCDGQQISLDFGNPNQAIEIWFGDCLMGSSDEQRWSFLCTHVPKGSDFRFYVDMLHDVKRSNDGNMVIQELVTIGGWANMSQDLVEMCNNGKEVRTDAYRQLGTMAIHLDCVSFLRCSEWIPRMVGFPEYLARQHGN